MEEPVTIIDKDILKTLSVDTRIEIIKELSRGERTPSYLSKKLNKSDSTIIEHLNELIKADLVKKIEHPGKKWVFYTLTERGHGIISSRSRRLIILLSTSIFTLVGSFASLFRYFSMNKYVTLSAEKIYETFHEEVKVTQTIPDHTYLYISVGLLIISLVCLGLYIYMKNCYKGDKKHYETFLAQNSEKI